MCGIVGVLQYESEVSREVRQQALKILFSDTMLKTEARGEDATGIFQVHRDSDWAMTKKGLRVTEWLYLDSETSDDPVVYSEFMDSWLEHSQELTALVGHCRKATVGSRGKDNEDNHPFAVQVDERNVILGIHNGTLLNHETIFKRLPSDMLKRQGQVDSEAIFHLMFHLSEHGSKPWDGEMLKRLGKRLDGAAACIVVNTKFPNKVATFRFGRPMEYILISPLNIVLICSDRKFAEAALDKYEFFRRMLGAQLPALDTFSTSLTEKDYRIFDTSKPWPAGKPAHQDLAKISESGDMRPYNSPLEKGWYTPASKTSQSSSGGSGIGTGYAGGHMSGGYAHGARGGIHHAKASKAGTNTTLHLPANVSSKKSEDEEGIVVEVEIGSQKESEQARMRAKSMGICTHYDSKEEVARSLGITSNLLEKLSPVELANLLARTHFNFGYAVSVYDSSTETDETRKKGRGLTQRLERSEDKKRRSENRIWELKQIITIMLSLDHSEESYPLTINNICSAISALSGITEKRKKDIEGLAGSILKDDRVQKLKIALSDKYKKASQPGQKQEAKTTTDKG